MLVACATFAYLAQGFKAAGLLASSGLPSKFFPQLVLGFMALCAIVVGYRYAIHRTASGSEEGKVFESPGDARRGLMIMAVAVLAYLVWSWAGFLPVAILAGPLSLLALGVRSSRIYAAVIILAGIIYLVFTRLLGVQLT